MSNRDNLFRTVGRMTEEHELGTFALYWSLYQDAVDVSNVQRFYVMVEPQPNSNGGYCNVAVIGDGLIVDVEGNDEQSSGDLSVYTLDSLIGVSVHAGALPGLPNTQDAILIVMVGQSSAPDAGLYWMAKTAEARERLIEFADALVKAISNR